MRTRVVVAGMAVLVIVAGIGLWRWWDERSPYPEPWQREVIGEMGITPDRRTVWIRAQQYRSGSCYELRGEVGPEVEGTEQEDTTWRARLESRRTQEWCTAEGCVRKDEIDMPARPLPADDATLPCAAVAVRLDTPIPPEVTLFPS